MATILIADDSPTAITLLRRILAPLGHRIVTATDGDEAARRVVEGPPDLIILDVVMPEQDGWDTCDQLREIRELRNVPVVFLTCVEGPGTLYASHGLYETDWDEYLRKPVNAKEIVRVVGKLLHRTAAVR